MNKYEYIMSLTKEELRELVIIFSAQMKEMQELDYFDGEVMDDDEDPRPCFSCPHSGTRYLLDDNWDEWKK